MPCSNVNAKRAGEPTVSKGSISVEASPSPPSEGLSSSLIVFQLEIVAVEFGNGIAEGLTARNAMSCDGEYQSCLAGVVEPVLKKKKKKREESEFFFVASLEKNSFTQNKKKTHRRRT